MEKLLCVDHKAAEPSGKTTRLPTNWLVERCVRFVRPGGTCAFHPAGSDVMDEDEELVGSPVTEPFTRRDCRRLRMRVRWSTPN